MWILLIENNGKNMCGIAGCIAKNNKICADDFERMTDVIDYRGPDDRGTYYNEKVALGHRRLSIIDISRDGHQPFIYNNDYIIVFNGEIYNYIEIRETLINNGYVFKTKTDTEVLIASYVEWGEECVNHFNGMWSFSILDRRKNVLFCSRDRFGVKPFYYTEQNGLFLFASEIKQFFEMIHTPQYVNKEVLLQYIVRGEQNDSEKETFFDGVYKLKPGHNLIYNLATDTYEVKRYYDLSQIDESECKYQEACDNFKKAFFDSVKLRLRADVPLGYCLSGGLDSSAIVSVANKIITDSKIDVEQHTVSSCFEDKRYDEREYIEAVVNGTKIKSHYIFPTENNLFEIMDDMIWHMDEPFGSTSQFAQWNVFKGAKDNGLKVMLDGQGADEELAGYTPFYTVLFAKYLRDGKLCKFVSELRKYKKVRAITEQHISSTDIILSSVSAALFRGKFTHLIKWLYFSIPGKSGPFSRKMAIECATRGKQFPFYDSKKYIEYMLSDNLSALLHYEDRNSMAHSIESRVPFLDVNLVRTILSTPIEYKLIDARTKAVMRDGLSGVLPDKVRDRYSKLGFVTPEDQWINNNHEAYKRELAEATSILSPILDSKRVLTWFDKKGAVQRSDFTVWRIICAAHWIKVFNLKFS